MGIHREWLCTYYPSQFAWKLSLAAMTLAAASSHIMTSDITSAAVLQCAVTSIAAIAIAQIYINVQLHHQPGLSSVISFECHLISLVSIVATACCGFLLRLDARRRLGTLSPVHDATAGTIKPKAAIISSLSDNKQTYESHRLGPLTKQIRRVCDASEVFSPDGDGDGGSMHTNWPVARTSRP